MKGVIIVDGGTFTIANLVVVVNAVQYKVANALTVSTRQYKKGALCVLIKSFMQPTM